MREGRAAKDPVARVAHARSLAVVPGVPERQTGAARLCAVRPPRLSIPALCSVAVPVPLTATMRRRKAASREGLGGCSQPCPMKGRGAVGRTRSRGWPIEWADGNAHGRRKAGAVGVGADQRATILNARSITFAKGVRR